MKKLFLIACMVLMSTATFAQAGKMAVGGNLSVGIYDNYHPIGFGPKLQWEFIDNVRGDVSLDLFTKKDGGGIWDINLNFHYLFNVARDINLYPLAGLTIVSTTGGGDTESMIGFNLGGGAEYYITKVLKLNAEIKYQYAKKKKNGVDVGVDGVVFSAGLAYVF